MVCTQDSGRIHPHDISTSPDSQFSAKQLVAENKIAENLSKLTELLARDPKEVAREYDRKCSRQKRNS